MNNLNKYLLSGLAGAMLAGISNQAALAADETGNASANVLAPLTITETTAMNFGDVGSDNTLATTVILTTAGATSSPDGAYTGGAPAAGAFNVTGVDGLGYNISLPTTDINLSFGANNMVVNTFTDSNGGTGTLTGGSDSFTVGATLNIGANQAVGLYTGTYTVTVDYQ